MSIRTDAMYKAARDASKKITCRRCAGSGTFMTDRICYGCNGSGVQRVATTESARLQKLAHVTEVHEMLVEAQTRLALAARPRQARNAQEDIDTYAAQLGTLQAELATLEAA